MDPLAWVLSVACGCVAVGYIAKVVANAVVRLREVQRSRDGVLLEQRLERMETALDAIAIEVERAGELQRFSAQLTRGTPAPPAVPRQVTPH
ncbi:MAG: hypothetical protein Q8K82_22375 [Gemmatimonadaceae bacterium]|nr:hypothetical protein [Gemmatimonadaceae bacterium]